MQKQQNCGYNVVTCTQFYITYIVSSVLLRVPRQEIRTEENGKNADDNVTGISWYGNRQMSMSSLGTKEGDITAPSNITTFKPGEAYCAQRSTRIQRYPLVERLRTHTPKRSGPPVCDISYLILHEREQAISFSPRNQVSEGFEPCAFPVNKIPLTEMRIVMQHRIPAH